ncbi:MAG: hypothetical protein QM758_04755 [Armatimonas sp.]
MRAVHHLWKAKAGDSDSIKERTIENRVADWLSPTDPAAFDLTAARLKPYATLPGLDSLLLRDAAPPGYRWTGDSEDGLALLGYTERNRQSFLSTYKKDIFDIAPAKLYYPQDSYTPWVRSGDSEAWRRWRGERLYEALNRLRRTIDGPAWLEGGLEFHTDQVAYPPSPMPGWLVRWTELQVDTAHLWQSGYNSTYKLIGNAQEAGATPWLHISVPPGSTRKTIEEHLGALESETGEGWQGRYIDLSELSLEETQKLVAG